MDGVLPKYYFSGEFADFQEELERLPHKKMCFRPGDVLWNAGEPVLYTYYFRKGFVQAYVEHEDGHRKILSFHGCGTIYPGFQKTDFKIEKSILVKAVTEVEADAYERRGFYDFCMGNPRFMERVCEVQSAYINMLIYDAAHQKFNDIFLKLCNFLYLMPQDQMRTGRRGICMTQEAIAGTLGVGRNHVTKGLSRLRREGIVRLHRGFIEIVDRQKLARYCSAETVGERW